MIRHVRPAAASVLVLSLLFTVVGCGRGGGAAHASASWSGSTIVMSGPDVGYAVLPSGSRWVVIGTTDGWHTVTDRTPTAVPTDGGLVLSAAGGHVAVGVLPHQQLTVSPLMVSHDGGETWAPGQLPGGLVAAAGALDVSALGVRAVVAGDGGQVVTAPTPRGPWRDLANASDLGTGRVTLTGLASPDGRTLTVSASGPSTSALLFASDDAGRSWRPVTVPSPAKGTATVLGPCRVDRTWLVPVVAGGELVVDRSSSLSGPWRAGEPIAVGTNPVAACGGNAVWVVGQSGSGDRLLLTGAAGGWADHGLLGDTVTSLSVASADTAFATVPGAEHLLEVRLGTSLTSTPIALPSWVATVGGGPMRN